MKKMNLTYDSVSGKYEIFWRFDENEHFYMNVTIPNGAQGQIILPNGRDYNATKGNYYYECKINREALI